MLVSPRHRERVALAWALCLPACHPPASSDTDATTLATTSSDASSTAPTSAGDSSTGEPAPPTVCAEPTDRTAAPRTIAEAVAFINELPRPLTLDCFLERLERPLSVAATTSIVSLQPAAGAHSPRLFLFSGELVMSIAVGGSGVDLLEFGELITPSRSIKAEIEFPLVDPLAADAPFHRVFDGGTVTKCAICHRDETAAPEYPLARASDALRFRDTEEVTLADLRAQHEQCDPAAQPGRCARLTALFGRGPVEPGAFPLELPTIYDYE